MNVDERKGGGDWLGKGRGMSTGRRRLGAVMYDTRSGDDAPKEWVNSNVECIHGNWSSQFMRMIDKSRM